MTTKYGIKEFIEEYRKALEEQPEQAKPQGKPNALEMLKSQAKLEASKIKK